MDRNLKNFLFHEVPLKVFLEILKGNTKSITKIRKETRRNYGRIVQCLKILEENGVIKTVKRSREREIVLTKKGQVIGQKLKELLNVIDSPLP